MTNQSRLDVPEIRAVLEANRAKLAMMQQQQQQQPQASAPRGFFGQKSSAPDTTTNPATTDGMVGISAAAAPKPSRPADASTLVMGNPMFGEDIAPTPAGRAGQDYAPKLAGAMRTPPLAGLSTDSGLPPVGDLFSPMPRLPAGLQLSSLPGAQPTFAAWDSSRPYLTGSFLFDGAADRAAGRTAPAPVQSLETYPPRIQESLLVDDLLHAFDGMEGTWVRSKLVEGRGGPRLEFRVTARGQLEPALLEMASRMLPVCESVAIIQRYIETRRGYGWGLVCQALAGAMRQVLQDWQLMVAQLEHQLQSGKLTLQALWYYVQPPMAALRLVATLAADASSKRLRGASLLNLLHTRAAGMLGDAAAHRLGLRLLCAAAEPYFSMLERWMCQGMVDDPYCEFMVQEDTSISQEDLSADGGSAWWADRFTLRTAADPVTGAPLVGDAMYEVPSFLERSKAAILDTGKYLNLVKSCGKQPQRALPSGVHLEYDEAGRYMLYIEQAHRGAAAEAMTLLRHEVGVSRGLSALKRYFLVAQGDLFLGFMDGGEEEMRRLVGGVPLPQLQAALDIAVRCSSAAADPSAGRLKAAYDHRSVLNMLIAITQTTGGSDSPQKRPKLRPVVPAPMTAAEKATVGRQKVARESFMLSYQVPWPLSIAAPDSVLAQYQMTFRHLFELKWVERELNRVCGLYQVTASLANMQRRATRRESMSGSAAAIASSTSTSSPAAATLGVAYRTCQVMTHFFRQYLLYATFEVLEPLWTALERHIETASTVDEICDHHRVFLRKVMKGLLLSRKVVVLRALLALKELALQFVKKTGDYLTIDYEKIEVDAVDGISSSGGGSQSGGLGGSTAAREKRGAAATERRRAKNVRVRAALDAALSDSEFSFAVRELRSKFEARCGDFMSALAEAHRHARSEKSDTREELESLLNLMARLDFNGYFARAGVGAVDAALADARR